MRESGARGGMRDARHQRRRARASGDRALGLYQGVDAGEGAGGFGGYVAGAVLDRHQPVAGAVRETHLYGKSAALFDVPGAGDV